MYLPYITVFEEERFKAKVDLQVINNYSFVKNTLTKNALIFSLNDKLLNCKTLFFATYIEPENSPYFNRNVYEEMQTIISNFNFEAVCLLGDFNSRTAELPDFLGSNSLSDISFEDVVDLNINNRISKDKQTNTMGHELLSFCKSSQFIICNGRVGQDASLGRLTCKNASVVDYVIVSPLLLTEVTDFYIEDFNEIFSDVHSPIVIEFCKKDIVDKQIFSVNDLNTGDTCARWNKNEEDNFISNLDCSKIHVYGSKDGEMVFPGQPLLRLEGPFSLL